LNEAFKAEPDFIRAFRWLEEKSIFPVDGALCEQSSAFVNACEFMSRYASAYQSKIKKANDRMETLMRGK